MDEVMILSRYGSVCSTPNGVFHVEHMPSFFDYDKDNMKPHVHSFYEIIWFQEGGGSHFVDFQEYKIEPNTLFFISPGQVHRFDGTTRSKGVLLKFCTDFLREEKADEDLVIKYNFFNDFASAPCFKVEDEAVLREMYALVDKVEVESERKAEFAHVDMLRSVLKIFLIQVQRYGLREGAPTLDTMRSSHRLFVHFRRELEKQYSKMHTVREYADALNVSTKTLSNCISECTGRQPLSIINDRIILEAKRLLSFTDMMVKEVAFQLGYEDPSYFVKFFKRETGYLPSVLKENFAI